MTSKPLRPVSSPEALAFPTVRGMDSIFWGKYMNLRHLRCFIAVAESCTLPAARRLHEQSPPVAHDSQLRRVAHAARRCAPDPARAGVPEEARRAADP